MPKKKSKVNTGAIAGYIRKSNLIWPPSCTTLEARTAFVDELRRTRVSELVTDAAARNQTIDVWYDDMGISGTGEFLEKRLAFDQLRRDVLAGKVRCLYARDLSRLFRNLVQQELWFGEMQGHGVEVCIQDLPFIADEATRTLLRQNVGAINQYFATRQGEVIRASNLERVRSGQWVGSGHSMWGLTYNRQTKHFDFDPATADNIIQLFTVFVECQGIAGQVVKRLNAWVRDGDPRAMRTAEGGVWSTTQVLQTIRNPSYRRRARYADLEVDAPHMIPEVVPPALVAEADRLLAQRAASPDPRLQALRAGYAARSGRVDSTYGPVLRCAYCDSRMRISRNMPKADGSRSVTWFCRQADFRKADCPQSSGIADARLDSLVQRGLAAAFRQAAQDSVRSSKALSRAQRSQAGPAPGLVRDKGDAQAALAKLEERQRRCYDLFINGLVSDLEELRPQLAQLAAQKKALEEQIAAGSADTPATPAELPRLSEAAWKLLATQFEEVWPETSPSVPLRDAKHALLRSLGVFIHAGAGRSPDQAERSRDDAAERGKEEYNTQGHKISRFGGPLTIRLEITALGCTGEQALTVTETADQYAAARQARFQGAQGRGRGSHGYYTPPAATDG